MSGHPLRPGLVIAGPFRSFPRRCSLAPPFLPAAFPAGSWYWGSQRDVLHPSRFVRASERLSGMSLAVWSGLWYEAATVRL